MDEISIYAFGRNTKPTYNLLSTLVSLFIAHVIKRNSVEKRIKYPNKAIISIVNETSSHSNKTTSTFSYNKYVLWIYVIVYSMIN